MNTSSFILVCSLALKVGILPEITTLGSIIGFPVVISDETVPDGSVASKPKGTDEEDAELSSQRTTELEFADLHQGRASFSLAESLDQVPGVFVAGADRFSHDMRLSIRGFGGQAKSLSRGVNVMLDDIPLTLADGQSQFEVIDPAFLERIMVLRGPVSSRYSNASGGVVRLEGRAAPPNLEIETSKLFGSYETWKSATLGGVTIDETQVSIFASRTQTEGFRDHLGIEQWNLRAHTTTRISDSLTFSTTIHYVNAPSVKETGEPRLSAGQWLADPSRGGLNNGASEDTDEYMDQWQIGSHLEADFGHHRFEANVHGGTREESILLEDALDGLKRDFYGAMLLYNWSEDYWLDGHILSVGIETNVQDDRRLQEGYDLGRVNRVATLLQTERAQSYGLFAEEQLVVAKRLTLSGGARVDKTEYFLRDDLMYDGDATSRRTMERVTIQGGLVYKFQPFTVFANLAQSYETPTLRELAHSSPDLGLSQELDMQEAFSYEVGLSGDIGQVVGFETSAYFIDLKDELVSSEDAQGRIIATNASESRRLGAELLGRFQPHPSVSLMGTYAWLHATFEDEERQGLFFPGVPTHRLFGRISYDDGHLFGSAEVEWVDKRMVNNDNTAFAPAHTFGELYVGWRFPATLEWLGELSLGLRNIFSAEYVDRINVNAQGGRYFEFGAPLHIFGALRLHYSGLKRLSTSDI